MQAPPLPQGEALTHKSCRGPIVPRGGAQRSQAQPQAHDRFPLQLASKSRVGLSLAASLAPGICEKCTFSGPLCIYPASIEPLRGWVSQICCQKLPSDFKELSKNSYSGVQVSPYLGICCLAPGCTIELPTEPFRFKIYYF